MYKDAILGMVYPTIALWYPMITNVLKHHLDIPILSLQLDHYCLARHVIY